MSTLIAVPKESFASVQQLLVDKGTSRIFEDERYIYYSADSLHAPQASEETIALPSWGVPTHLIHEPQVAETRGAASHYYVQDLRITDCDGLTLILAAQPQVDFQGDSGVANVKLVIHRLSVELSPNLLEKQQEGGAEMTFIDTVKVLIVPQWGEDSTLIDWAPDGTDSSTRKVTCKTEDSMGLKGGFSIGVPPKVTIEPSAVRTRGHTFEMSQPATLLTCSDLARGAGIDLTWQLQCWTCPGSPETVPVSRANIQTLVAWRNSGLPEFVNERLGSTAVIVAPPRKFKAERPKPKVSVAGKEKVYATWGNIKQGDLDKLGWDVYALVVATSLVRREPKLQWLAKLASFGVRELCCKPTVLGFGEFGSIPMQPCESQEQNK